MKRRLFMANKQGYLYAGDIEKNTHCSFTNTTNTVTGKNWQTQPLR